MTNRSIKKNEDYKQVGNEESYRDFDSSFFPHPFTQNLTTLKDVDAIKNAIRNLLLTNKYERLRNPEFGSNIRRFLFENFGPATKSEIKTNIEKTIDRFEPRAKVLEIEVDEDPETYSMYIRVTFAVQFLPEPQTVEVSFVRVR